MLNYYHNNYAKSCVVGAQEISNRYWAVDLEVNWKTVYRQGNRPYCVIDVITLLLIICFYFFVIFFHVLRSC